jgi:hypothetical protein
MEQVECGIRMDNEKTVERSSGTMLSCNEAAVSAVNTNDSNKTDVCRGDIIPIEPLFVMDGTFNEKPVRILKDDGCSTNVVSRKVRAEECGGIQDCSQEREVEPFRR